MRAAALALAQLALALAVLAGVCALADGGTLAWGTFLGADWRAGEERLRNDLAVFLKNTQRTCAKDVENLCTRGRYADARARAYADWSSSGGEGRGSRRRRRRDAASRAWEAVPLGFGADADACLRAELARHRAAGTTTRQRIIPKCVEWMEKSEGQFARLGARERGNDRRERCVVFATVFAVAAAGVVGYLCGVYLRDRDDVFAYHDRDEHRRALLVLGAAMAVPACIVLWTSPRLLLIMAVAFGTGRGAQCYVHGRKEAYALVPGSDAGSVFAAVPVQLD